MELHYRYEARPWTLNAERSGDRHSHWSTTRRMTAEWRKAFGQLALTQKRIRLEVVEVEALIVMKGRLADAGNHLPAVKAALDGIVDAGIIPDDSPEHVRRLILNAPRRPLSGERENLTLIVRSL